MISPRAVFKFNIAKIEIEGYRTEWPVPLDLPYFEGHFPGNPILPAVGIIDATIELLRAARKLEDLRVSRIVSAKFTSPVFPGAKVEITAHRLSDQEWKAEWRALDPASLGKLLADLRLTF